MDVNYFPKHRHAIQSAESRDSVQGCHGVSAIELVLGLAIMATLLAVAAPSFSSLLQDTRLSTSVNTLVTTLQHARSEAIKRGGTIVVCKGNFALGCNSRQSWAEGWISFVDDDGDEEWGEDEAQLWSQSALPDGTTLRLAAFPSPNYIVYYPQGHASSNGSFVFCDERGERHAKVLILAKTGRLRLTANGSQGKLLTCPE